MGIGCFKGTFSLQVKPDSKPYQAPTDVWHMHHKNHLMGQLEKLQRQDIITPLGVDESVEWYKALPGPCKIELSAYETSP